ncbi:SusC/RagA family TonB-linked outer membrane protein [Adhaeribacter aerolatus]|uniref:SusC/RagA family TonB-linked outer membrane protein n=1 Tax=Adhaeribacter aerolatus TaxID=670289 RepID=A0A512B2V2_9BACT|nr:TonB-dependent receptor [Adhaeribacter aerolatus]GEO06296.1 SusC/RagA family TonB-linked outer membrane protein [Adhaeribacter aerolatus]
MKNETLVDAFQKIEKLTPFRFMYRKEDVQYIRNLNLAQTRTTVADLLNNLLTPNGFTYKQIDTRILVNARQNKTVTEPAEASSTSATNLAQLIKGKVTDENGDPLPGVVIVVKGTSLGTSTDAGGNYQIEVPGESAVLIFSFIGFKSQEVVAGANATQNITLVSDSKALSEVVVVGYGVQKKVNLTGSVATIDAKAIENRPVTNVSSALAGLSPGVSVQQSSGRPGSDGATIRIRGTGTLNNNDALVIIDGIQGRMDAVNPNDIESISILKDAASASIYGSLAANGVILITTKKGKKGTKPTLSYNGILSQTRPLNMPKMVSDYITHMQLVNEGFRNLGLNEGYNQSTIDAWTNAKQNPNGTNDLGVPNYIAYPNTDWADVIFQNKTLQNHNISLNGGSENISFLLSGGYLNNPGTMENSENIRYQFRANLQAKVSKFLSIGTNTFASTETFGMGGGSTFDILYASVPGQYPYLDGKYGYAQTPEEVLTNNPLQTLRNTGGKNRASNFNTTFFANADIYKGLKFETRVNYQTRFTELNTHSIPTERWDFGANILRTPQAAPANLTTNYAFGKNYNLIFDNILHYNTTLAEKHEIGVLAGYNQNYFNNYNFNAGARGLIDATITTLGSATTPLAPGGEENDWAIRSWFGRLNYAFNERYLLEGVFRYDGSSRFDRETRWGFFPAMSAGWRISEESFMQGINNYVSNLKLRASYGKTGNNASGNYEYQSTYTSQNYSFNNIAVTALAKNRIANRNLRWETTTLTDIGLEGGLLGGAINFELDWYNKVTDGILFRPDIPITVGTASAPTRNIAEVVNRGIEVSLGYQGQAGQFKYAATGNFAYNYNNVTKYKGKFTEGYTTDEAGNRVYTNNLGDVTTGGNQRIAEGHLINEYYLYNLYQGNGTYKNTDGTVAINGGPRDGMIRTPADLEWVNAMLAAGYKFLPANTLGKGNIYYGDFIYADANGDGSYGNTYDLQFTGASATPRYNFGLQSNLSWKGLDMFMLWTGSAGMKYFWNGRYNNSIVELGDGVLKHIADDHYYYDETNPANPSNNINGKYPRLKAVTDAQNTLPSTFNLYNASYVKLKSLQIGYTLPDNIVQKALLSRARIYFAGENLLTITKYPGLDPEIAPATSGPTVGYPTMKQYSLGVNVTF